MEGFLMKLNIGCMRDTLLALEQFEYGQPIHHKELEKILASSYSEADIQYSLLKLSEAGYIRAQIFNESGFCFQVNIIFDITYTGHEFLNSVRPKTVWQKISHLIGKTGIESLSIANGIAKTIATDEFSKLLLSTIHPK